MHVFLRKIVLYNFKTYYGEVTIGPFMPFTGIAGPNGVGKSNIMDAISFVMGEKNNALRIRQLNDLISRKLDGTPMARSLQVTAIFEVEDKIKEFTRGVRNSCNEYKIDNQVVAFELYIHELASLGLNIKTRNFLVYQGCIESMGIASPKVISVMFDELSKSSELRSKYERYKSEKHKIDQDLYYKHVEKKFMLAEKHYLRLQEKEAEEYNLLQNECRNKRTELQLFRLFYIRKELKRLKLLFNDNKSKIYEYEDDKKKAEIVLQRKEKRCDELTNDQEKIENELTIMEQQLAHNNVKLITAKEKVFILQQYISRLRKSLTEAHHANESHKETIKDLQDELAKIEQLKISLTQSISSQLQSQGSNIELDNAQVQEYYLLKDKVRQECAEYIKCLNCLKNEQENDQNKLDNENRKKQEMQYEKRKLLIELNHMEEQIKRLEQHIITTEVNLTEQKKLQQILETEITQNKITVEETSEELNRISKELNDTEIDKFSISRKNQQLNTINILKDLFPEVYGRLSTMCKPINERYNIAVTKIFWRYKDAIVVKTEKVAKECIHYMKAQKMSVETFLPLDSLKMKPLSKKLQHILRNMEDSKKLLLLYNAIEFFPKEISNAILFVTKNILLCEASEDAQRVAYETHSNDKYTCIALDGSYYHKSGIISGGTSELLTKAAMWQNKHVQQLNIQKVALIEKLKEASGYTRKQSELNTVNLEILSLTSKLKYSHTDMENIKKQMISLKKKSESVDQQLILISDNIEPIQKAMDTRFKTIEDIENRIYKVEDIAFTIFCRSINVTNIREYEKGGLRKYKEQVKRKTELENQYNRIKNTLDCDILRNTKDNIIEYETAIKFNEEKLRMTLLEKSAIESDIKKFNNELNNLKDIRANMEIQIVKLNNEIAQYRRQIDVIAKLIVQTGRAYTACVMIIKKKVTELYSIIKDSKMKGIPIPMLSQNAPDTSGSSLIASNSNTSEESDDGVLSKIDFSYLSNELQTTAYKEFENIENQLGEDVKTLENKLELIPAPDLKAEEKLALIRNKLSTINTTLKEIHVNARIASEKFTRVKNERINRFMKCFDYITSHIDEIYKHLLKNMSVQASLVLHNPEEPYLDGITYSCIAPGKRFHVLSSLSGGEQVLANLILLFTMHKYEAAPFIFLDEIDAALDKINVENLVRFIQSNIDLTYFITISLKTELFAHADALIGVSSRLEREFLESSVFTLSLKPYKAQRDERPVR